MLAERRVHVTLPVADLDRARAFYEGKLGFRPYNVQPTAVLYRAGADTYFAVSKGTATSTGAHTQMAFTTHDLEAEVADARARGIVFEEYDFPGFMTVDGIAPVGPNRAAWFKDSEGNLIGIIQFADPSV
jgi:catechol 2,3-dioxygenase-like lactoylglutathione lyase family enzyme